MASLVRRFLNLISSQNEGSSKVPTTQHEDPFGPGKKFTTSVKQEQTVDTRPSSTSEGKCLNTSVKQEQTEDTKPSSTSGDREDDDFQLKEEEVRDISGSEVSDEQREFEIKEDDLLGVSNTEEEFHHYYEDVNEIIDMEADEPQIEIQPIWDIRSEDGVEPNQEAASRDPDDLRQNPNSSIAKEIVLQCEICGCSFSRKARLKRHIYVHSERKSNMDRSSKHRGRSRGRKSFKCTECGCGFPEKDDLIKHYFLHPRERPHKCDVCGYAFGRKSVLNRHMISHKGEKPLKCDECGHLFSKKCNLNTHIKRVHTVKGCESYRRGYLRCRWLVKDGALPSLSEQSGGGYRCDECGRGFRDRSGLKHHIRIYSRQTPSKAM